MRVRYLINEKGELVDTHGYVLGKLVSLTLDVVREGGDFKGGVGSGVAELEQTQERQQRDGGSGEGELEDVWEHYVEVMQPRRRELDPAARATIRESLKVATADELKRAVDGCRASTFHMGENDRGRKYNRLTQIIKGKRGIRSTREQIDLFLDIAEKAGVGDHLPSVDPARLSVAKQNVLTAWEFPGSEQAKKAGEMSAAWLAQHGYRIERDPDTGRPTFEWVSS